MAQCSTSRRNPSSRHPPSPPFALPSLSPPFRPRCSLPPGTARSTPRKGRRARLRPTSRSLRSGRIRSSCPLGSSGAPSASTSPRRSVFFYILTSPHLFPSLDIVHNVRFSSVILATPRSSMSCTGCSTRTTLRMTTTCSGSTTPGISCSGRCRCAYSSTLETQPKCFFD